MRRQSSNQGLKGRYRSRAVASRMQMNSILEKFIEWLEFKSDKFRATEKCDDGTYNLQHGDFRLDSFHLISYHLSIQRRVRCILMGIRWTIKKRGAFIHRHGCRTFCRHLGVYGETWQWETRFFMTLYISVFSPTGGGNLIDDNILFWITSLFLTPFCWCLQSVMSLFCELEFGRNGIQQPSLSIVNKRTSIPKPWLLIHSQLELKSAYTRYDMEKTSTHSSTQ